MNRIAGLLALVAPLVVGCGGFDPEYDCEQELACDGGGDEEEVDLCSDVAEVFYDHASDEEQEEIDDAYEACKDKTSCEYLSCRDAELAGLDTDNLSKQSICGPCSADDLFLEACNASYDACTGDSGCELIDLAVAFQDACGPADGELCGDDYADENEDCDGTDLWEEDCDSITLGSRPNGILSCNADCTYNLTRCTP